MHIDRLAILVLALVGSWSTCFAQFKPCQFSDVSAVERKENILIRHTNIVEPSGVFKATAFIPEREGSLPGALVSHSIIRGARARTNLLRFAWTLARAGVASITLDGVIEWQSPNNESVRDPHLMACAGQWVLLHAKLDRHRLLNVGTFGDWGGGDTPWCQLGERPCFKPNLYIGLGQTSAVEAANTDGMLTVDGQLTRAQWAQRHLRLPEIRPEWLVGVSEEGTE